MNILIFGPNGSGKGTQGGIIQKKYNISHVESGVLFRENIGKGTELGNKAQAYIERGDLVPDEVTIPMILDRIMEDDCREGWLLDGFPRNPEQAKALDEALSQRGIDIDYVIEIKLDRNSAKNRIMGRRLCSKDNNHPNNIFIDAIKPVDDKGSMKCRVCGGGLTSRADDQDETAIDKRHDIYYDEKEGTLAAVNYFKNKPDNGKTIVIELDGSPGVQEVSEALMAQLR